MKVLELFAGTRSIGKAFEARGHEVFSIEWDKDFKNIDMYADIGQLKANDILERFGQHICRFAHYLYILYHRVVGAFVSNKGFESKTFNKHRHIVGILYDVLQPPFIPRSFSHKSAFYHG